MLDSVDVDVAVFCKKIYDCLRCAVCDKGGGGRLRFACGHTACTDCANSSDCPICFTNSQTSQPVVDDVLKARVENAGNLLTSYQDLFSLDVYKKQKLSEKLKIEKQLFPACIQAPSKYYNKRKSSCNSFKGKENQLLFLGEEVSSNNLIMDHKINLVKNWLADNEQIQRKPLVDLNVNQRIINDNNTLKSNNFTASKKRKKSTLKSLKSKKQKFSDKVNSDQKQYFKNKEIFLSDEIDAFIKNQNKTDTVQVDDEPIIIDDSQTDVVDKDKEAWLKVVEIHMNELNEQTKESNKNCDETIDMVVIKPTESDRYKVPFYKKSCLKDPCKICDESVSENGLNSTENNEVTIVVTNNLFETTITVSKDFNSFDNNVDTKSIEIQTEGIQIKTVQNSNDKNLKDKTAICSKMDQEILKNNFVKTNTNNAPVIFSEDLFSDEKPVNISELNKVNSDAEYVCNIDANSRKREHLVIDESDSDDSLVPPNHMQVKADIHRSCTEFDYGVLSEVRDEVEHSQKSRRPARGLTPDSSNSSEKENYHPNKPKKAKRDKKNTYKK